MPEVMCSGKPSPHVNKQITLQISPAPNYHPGGKRGIKTGAKWNRKNRFLKTSAQHLIL